MRQPHRPQLFSLGILIVASLACVPADVAQEAAPETDVAVAAPTHPWAGTDESVVPGGDAQINAAVTAAPRDLRDDATVLGRGENGELTLLRRGSNELVCIADDPTDERFQVACYHVALEPYMARGRELRAQGITGPDGLAARHAEVDAGTLPMPDGATMVYTLGGPQEMHDAASGDVDESLGRRVYATYIAYATEESSGLSSTPPQRGAPWIMRPGTASSHIMVVIDPATPSEADGS